MHSLHVTLECFTKFVFINDFTMLTYMCIRIDTYWERKAFWKTSFRISWLQSDVGVWSHFLQGLGSYPVVSCHWLMIINIRIFISFIANSQFHWARYNFDCTSFRLGDIPFNTVTQCSLPSSHICQWVFSHSSAI